MSSKQPKTIDEIRKSLPERERRIVPASVAQIEVRAADGEPPKITMRIPYESDSERLGGGFIERIAPGAFARSIRNGQTAKNGRGDVVSLWNHDPAWVLGRQSNGTLHFEDGDTALEASVTLDGEDMMHRHFLRRVERRDVQGSSFGFEVVKRGDEWDERDDGTPVRTLTEVRLADVSPVTFPAYPESQSEARSLVDVALVRSGVDLSELAEILGTAKGGKIAEASREEFRSWIKRLETMLPPLKTGDDIYERRLALHEKVLRATQSVGGTDHPMEDFAYRPAGSNPSDWKLPIFDADHAQNALARWNQTDMPNAAEKAKALDRILAACRKFNIDTSGFEKMHAA